MKKINWLSGFLMALVISALAFVVDANVPAEGIFGFGIPGWLVAFAVSMLVVFGVSMKGKFLARLLVVSVLYAFALPMFISVTPALGMFLSVFIGFLVVDYFDLEKTIKI